MPSTLTSTSRASTGAEFSEVKALAAVLHEEFDARFQFHDATTGERFILSGEPDRATVLSAVERALLDDLATEEYPKVVCLEDGCYLVGFPLDGYGPSRLVALGRVSALVQSLSERATEQVRLAKWARAVQTRLRADRDMRDLRRSQAEQERQSMIAWDAVMALDRLHRSLRIHKEPARHRRRVLRIAGELLGARALAWVSLHDRDDIVLEGEPVLSRWDCGQLANHLVEQTRGGAPGYVLVNEPRECSWGVRFPQILNLLAVFVTDDTLSGCVLALNKKPAATRNVGGRERHRAESGEGRHCGEDEIAPYRRSDVALLLPFASLLGLHVRASQNYTYIKEVMVGLTRSLTAAIDAKDAYTYGHSERVARAAVELGRELGLQEAEQNDIYLAGLLHDIGKIGVRDAILAKREPLTDDELAHIRQHPVIGYRILAELHAISHLLPGVLYHHELFDGSGYPEGLKQDTIPLLARILAVADSFDAMNTSRPYRAALPPDRVDQILREGAGTQWDPWVVDAYFRCRDRLVAIRQRGLGESLGAALDGALRTGKGESDLASLQHASGS